MNGWTFTDQLNHFIMSIPNHWPLDIYSTIGNSVNRQWYRLSDSEKRMQEINQQTQRSFSYKLSQITNHVGAFFQLSWYVCCFAIRRMFCWFLLISDFWSLIAFVFVNTLYLTIIDNLKLEIMHLYLNIVEIYCPLSLFKLFFIVWLLSYWLVTLVFSIYFTEKLKIIQKYKIRKVYEH